MFLKTFTSSRCIKKATHLWQQIYQFYYGLRWLCQGKKEEIWPSPMTKAPTPTEMSKGQSDNTNNATKSSIKQQLRTDLGRSVGVTTATKLVWLTWFTCPPSHSPQQPCNRKDTHKKIVNKPPCMDNKPSATSSGEVIKINTQTA